MENPIITVVYSHGRFGSPWYGFKIEALRPVALRLGVNMISIRYSEDISVEQMEDKLYTLLSDDVSVPGDLVFLSSSRGAYISTRVSHRIIDCFSTEPERRDEDKVLPRRHVLGQFFIAPAFYIKPEYYPDQDPQPAKIRTAIVHGIDDHVINCDNSIKFAKRFDAQLSLLKGGHRMNSQRDYLCLLFEKFLRECMVESEKIFAKWLEKHPQPASESDDMPPTASRK